MSASSISYRNILKLAFPIILGGIAQNVIMATDAFFMGRVDEVSLAAVGLSGLFYSTIYILGLGFSIGIQILVARRHGEKEYKSIGAIFDNSLFFLGGLSLFLWAGMEWIGPLVLKQLIKSPAVYEAAILYLDGRAWGITFALINLVFRAFYVGISIPRIITISTIIMAVVNVLLNYALIFGNWGFPAWGIKGSAIASSLSEVVAVAILLIYTFRSNYYKSFDLFRSWKWNPQVMKQISNIASPIMFQYFISHAGWFLFFIIIEQSGERALAISVVIRIIYMFQMVPFWGFSSATNTLVSYLIGEGNSRLVIPVLKRITGLSIMCALLLIIPNLLVPEWIIGLAVENKNTAGLITDSVSTLYVISLALLLFALAMTWFSGVSGSGNTRTALLIETGAIFIYLIVAWVLGIYRHADVHIIWLTEPLYFLMMGVVSWLYMKSGKWKERGTI